MISVYKHKTEIEVGPRRIDVLANYNEIVQRGRRNPVWFIENILKVKLLDYQKWLIMGAWTAHTICFVCSRNTGKSFIAALYMMTRTMLIPNCKTWIMSATASQAQDTFTKLENIAKHQIPSLTNTSDVYANEVIKSQANTDGFTHDKQRYKLELFNGSTIVTLVGKAENEVGKRSNLSVWDEAAIINEEFFARTEPFSTQSAKFQTGEGIDLSVNPIPLPNQKMYLSSAGDVNSHLWTVYKECAKRMAMGDTGYFVADIGCEVPLNPTMNGKPYAPLFERSEVDLMMRNNPYRGLREYYNIFDQAGGTDSVVTRDQVLRNVQNYLPIFKNTNKNPDDIYGIFFDPALQADNSFVLIGRFFRDPDKGWMGQIVNGINLLQILPNGDKKPMRSTEQLEKIKQLMIDYNGDAPEYQRLHLFIDPGSGGGGRIYAETLVQGWYDKRGNYHHGVIDMLDDTSAQDAAKFPRAVKDVLRLLNAQKYKNDMYAALGQMVQEDLIIFPPELPNNALGILNVDGKDHELNPEERRALLEMDLMKEEIYLMRKTKTEAGNVRYALPADRQRTAHDDRAYCLAAFAYYLQELRSKDIVGEEAPKSNMSILYAGGHRTGGSKFNNPFAGRKLPFGRK